ncbi:hypothetical protein [Sulfurimonas sp.]|uniref:hypothetical protein n=1 Tax=Sulfurimonas sp. TaxID=2022749 RepID=UPI0025EB06A4|nr:hypothetical protein [Sulfurimonas sp.]MDD5156659.1 hypothetical protein [Sulfurimonas sp.]
MKKHMVARAIIALISSFTILQAESNGFYGNLEYGYTENRASDVNNKSSQEAMIQNYTLGKTGYVYNPNLMSYLVQGSLMVTDTTNKTNDQSYDSKNKSMNYRVSTDFIRSTKYPFSLYGEKTSNPYSSIQAGSSMSYNQTDDRYGVNGSVELPYFNLRYSGESSDMQRDETNADETRKNKNYTLSVDKRFNDGTFSAVYSNRTRDYLRDDRYFQSKQEWSDQAQDIRINGSWNVDKTLRIDSYLTYMDSSYSDMKNMMGSVNINWNPTAKYMASVGATASTISSGGKSSDTVMLFGNSSYMVTPEFTTTQNVSLYRVAGDYSDMTMGTAMLGGHYTKALEDNLVLTAGLDVIGKVEKNKAVSDINITAPDRNSYSYTASFGASKRVEAISSSLSGNLSYYNSESTLNDSTKRISANMMLSTMISNNFYNTLSGYYTSETGRYYTDPTTGAIQMDLESVTVDNNLRYWYDVGYDGKISLGGGVTYSESQYNQQEKLVRIFPHAEGSFTYKFFRTLLFNSNLSASQDSVSDLTNYSAYIGLNYTLRKIIMSFGTRYFYQTSGASSGASGVNQESTQSSVFFKISRSF